MKHHQRLNSIFWAAWGPAVAIVAATAMAVGAASPAMARLVVVPDVLTITATGAVRLAADGLDLFGGGDLTGMAYTEVFTLKDTLPPYLNSFGLSVLDTPVASVATTINGHTYTLAGAAYAQDVTLAPGDGPPFDERVVSLSGPGPDNDYIGDSVARFPPQWGGDPAALSLFLDDTVSGQTGYGVGSVMQIFSGAPGAGHPYTGLNFNVTSITTSHTETIAFIPEPGAWALLTAGLAGLGAALRRRRSAGVAAVSV